MRGLRLGAKGERLRVLALGAHSDDIEIGLGGTILELIAQGVELEIDWCVLSGDADRHAEARASAEAFLLGAAEIRLHLRSFPDGRFPYAAPEIKSFFETLKDLPTPDLVFTHTREDRHQDHREVCQLTWNTFRDHLILEYEIPKWDGDLGRADTYIALSRPSIEQKCALLMEHFGTQRSKKWFDPDTFLGLARLRGLECTAPDRFAEAFYARKTLLSLS